MLGLRIHAPVATPAVERAPGEVGEAARGATLGLALGLNRGEIVADDADQTLVAGEPASHQLISACRAKPEGVRSRISTRGQRARIGATIRAEAGRA
jgi:hypothetical protein